MNGFKKCTNGHYYKDDLDQCPYCPKDKELEKTGNNSTLSGTPQNTTKLTKEQIDKALVQLKELRKEPTYSGHIPHNNAMCYSMAMPTYFEWNRVPGIWKCPHCGKDFGNGKPIETYSKSNRGRDFIGRDKDEDSHGFGWFGRDDRDKNYYIEKYKLSSMLNTWLDAMEYGYNIALELHCQDCILSKGKPVMIFKFKFDNAEDYTISYPTESNIYEYATTLSFLKELKPNMALKDVSTALKKVFSGMSYEGVAWSDIFDILQKILGGTENGGK